MLYLSMMIGLALSRTGRFVHQIQVSVAFYPLYENQVDGHLCAVSINDDWAGSVKDWEICAPDTSKCCLLSVI